MRLDKLSNAPLDDAPRLTEDAQLLLDEIDSMVSDGRWFWAQDTLLGIAHSVSTSGTVSVNQHRAVENIRAGGHKEKASRSGWGRRYEGHR